MYPDVAFKIFVPESARVAELAGNAQDGHALRAELAFQAQDNGPLGLQNHLGASARLGLEELTEQSFSVTARP